MEAGVFAKRSSADECVFPAGVALMDTMHNSASRP